MTKVVYSPRYGGFGLSHKAVARLRELGIELKADYEYSQLQRHNPLLVQVVEELGDEANGPYAKLKIAKVFGDRYRIHEYDGNEEVQETGDIDWIYLEEQK